MSAAEIKKPDFKRAASNASRLDAASSRPPAPLAPVRLLTGDAVKIEPVRWLWDGYLPAGMVTILGGSPGCGKSTIALSLAATVTRGGSWPDGSRCDRVGDVVIWSSEDQASVSAARLRAASADMDRVHFIDTAAADDCFDPSHDIPKLEATMERLPAARLLVLDPIVSAVAGDSHKGAEVRRSLQPVVDLAHRLGCAVLGITHFSKGTSGRDPVERVTGSIAFAALARLVLVAAKVKPGPDDEGEERRVLVRAKSNIGPDDGGFAYSLERVEVAPEVLGQCVRWLEPLDGSAREVLSSAEADAQDDGDSNDAAGFLRGLLADGPVAAKTIFSEASGAAYSRDQMQRAARRLGVERRKTGMAGGWTWALPAPKRPPEDGEDGRLGLAQSSPPLAPPSAPPSGLTVLVEVPDDDTEVF